MGYIEYSRKHIAQTGIMAGLILFVAIGGLLYSSYSKLDEDYSSLNKKYDILKSSEEQAAIELADAIGDLEALRNVDQFVKNEELESNIKNIETTYNVAVETYDDLLKLKESTTKTSELDSLFAKALSQLAEQNYSSAEATLATLKKDITIEQAKFASAFSIPAAVAAYNEPPGSGYRRQKVKTEVGTYLVDIISADLNSTRVVVDTASDGDCSDDCPVDSLGSYAARSGAFAGINGPYFCPASYASCAGKTNSFDTLLMNKNKHYFNSDNNVYSTVPAVIFSGNSARFVGKSQEWGRDTGVDSVIANQPLLTLNGQRVFGGDGEPKRSGKGSRSFIGTTDSTVYIGVVHNASTAEMAHVLQALGISSSLNLDSGGSTALWNNGRYLVGPGRNTPYGILFVGK